MRKAIIAGLGAVGVVLVLACGHPGKQPDDGTAPKHHAPPRPRSTSAEPRSHSGMQTAQQPATLPVAQVLTPCSPAGALAVSGDGTLLICKKLTSQGDTRPKWHVDTGGQ